MKSAFETWVANSVQNKAKDWSYMDYRLVCPSCGKPLAYRRGQKIVSCAQNHQFDEAKEGYLNLLLSHQKNSKQPGDSKEMLQARRRFLEGGYYTPIVNQIAKLIISNKAAIPRSTGEDKVFSLLDIGCGEGYYLRRICSLLNLELNDVSTDFWGIDISKEAIKMAAKSARQIHWLVGNNFKLPFLDQSLDCVLSVFSPVQSQECCRVLKEKGLFVQVYPFEDHLDSLKSHIYKDDKKSKDYEKYLEAPMGFKLIAREKVGYTLNLNCDAVADLLQMTPHYWMISQEQRGTLLTQTLGEMRISMGIVVYQKEA